MLSSKTKTAIARHFWKVAAALFFIVLLLHFLGVFNTAQAQSDWDERTIPMSYPALEARDSIILQDLNYPIKFSLGQDRSLFIANNADHLSDVAGSNQRNMVVGYRNLLNAAPNASDEELFVFGTISLVNLQQYNADSIVYPNYSNILSANRNIHHFGSASLNSHRYGGQIYNFGRVNFGNHIEGGRLFGFGELLNKGMEYGSQVISIGYSGVRGIKFQKGVIGINSGSVFEKPAGSDLEVLTNATFLGGLNDIDFSYAYEKSIRNTDSLNGVVGLATPYAQAAYTKAANVHRFYNNNNVIFEIDSLNRYQFTGNAKDANDIPLANGEILQSDGTQMNAAEVVNPRVQSATLDFSSLGISQSEDLTINVSCQEGDAFVVSPPAELSNYPNVQLTYFISAPNTVTIRASYVGDNTGGVDMPALTYTVTVLDNPN